MMATALLTIALVCAPGARAAALDEVPHTVWPEQFRDHEVTLESWEARHPRSGPWKVEVLREAAPAVRDGGRGRVAVLVDDGLQGPLEGPLETFVDDLVRDGHGVILEAVAGGSAEELKAHLVELYAEDLVGAILVGPLPSGWFEIANDYDEYGYVQFPCDLFYADLDGAWADADGDGRYDAHGDGQGDRPPEIWIGHLLVTDAMGDEVAVLTDYLARNHAYRRGDVLGDGSALVYVDDDWAYWVGEYVDELDGAFPDVTYEAQANVTTAEDYLPRLQQSYDNIAVYVHSSPEAHFFVEYGEYGWMMFSEIPPAADALFYNLFACSNANFADYVYMAGSYVFNTDAGLVAVGSTKTGSMLYAGPYYRELSEYEEFGDALRTWWHEIGPYGFDNMCWHYGMTLIGDPTLRIAYPTIGVDPGEIEEDAEPGDDPRVRSIEIGNLGADHLDWSVSVDQPWMSVEPASGSGHAELTLTLHPALAGDGDHHGVLLVESPGATNHPLEVPVVLRLPPAPDGDDPGGGGCRCRAAAGPHGGPGQGLVAAALVALLLGSRGARRRPLPNR